MMGLIIYDMHGLEIPDDKKRPLHEYLIEWYHRYFCNKKND